MGEHQGYPVILGGDHAAFELGHAGMDPKMRPDWPLPSFNAQDWAQAFCKIFKVTKRGEPLALDADDHDLMVTWFANALMRGYDEQFARTAPALEAALSALREVEEFLDDQADVSDGIPNDAMRHLVEVRAAIAKIEAL